MTPRVPDPDKLTAALMGRMLRVGDRMHWDGERLREIGLEPSEEPTPTIRMRVVSIDTNTMTVETVRGDDEED